MSFTALPPELLREIIARIELEDLISLCRTSRQLHTHSAPLIYRSVSVANDAQVVKLCKTIISREDTARSIRELEMCALVSHLSFYIHLDTQ